MSDMCADNRFELIEKYKKELVEATNIETIPEEMQVLDNILFRFWQMGWLDSIDRMPLVKESAMTLMHSRGDSVSAKALRNAGRLIRNAIDGEAVEFEEIPSAEPHWISVFDELPDEGQAVVALEKGKTWDCLTFEGTAEWTEDERMWKKKEAVIRIDYWMPKDSALPEPYKEEGEQK